MCVMYDSTVVAGYPHKNLPFTLRKTVEITESAGKKTWRKGRCCELILILLNVFEILLSVKCYMTF